MLCQKVMWYSGVQGGTSLLFGGSNKIGPLGIVVIYMSCNFCLALHYDAQAGKKKVRQQFTSQGMLILCFLFNWQTL